MKHIFSLSCGGAFLWTTATHLMSAPVTLPERESSFVVNCVEAGPVLVVSAVSPVGGDEADIPDLYEYQVWSSSAFVGSPLLQSTSNKFSITLLGLTGQTPQTLYARARGIDEVQGSLIPRKWPASASVLDSPTVWTESLPAPTIQPFGSNPDNDGTSITFTLAPSAYQGAWLVQISESSDFSAPLPLVNEIVPNDPSGSASFTIAQDIPWVGQQLFARAKLCDITNLKESSWGPTLSFTVPQPSNPVGGDAIPPPTP